MRPLNVKVIIDQINNLKAKNRTDIQRVTKRDSIIEFSPLYNGFFSYSLKLADGSMIDVSGHSQHGYYQQSFRKNDHYVDFRSYYGDGKIKSAGKIYIDSLQETTSLIPAAKIKFPVGITENYSADGNLISVFDYDKIFNFTYKDLISVLFSEDDRVKINSIDGTVFTDGNAVWRVSYESKANGLSYLEIDGKNGEILSQMHHMKMVE